VRTRLLLSLAVLGALVAGCGTATGPGAAATVDGTDIPRERLETAVRELTADATDLEPSERNQLVADTQRQVLGFLIEAQVIMDLAAERGVEVSDDEVQDRFEQDVEQFGGEEALGQQLRGAGLTVELYREVLLPASLRLDTLRDELADGIETEDVETRTTRHILVETEDEAQDILDELGDGADFAELAQERSIDPGSGAQGGDLGEQPRGRFVPEFDDAVWGAEVGDVLGPIESNFGFHVIEVLDEGTIQQPAGGADPQQVTNQLVDQLLLESFLQADVTVAPGLGTWDAASRQILPAGEVGQGAEPGQPDVDELLGELDGGPVGE
jgi:parvulin-like peptidyl-prolyl isomerase